MKPARYRLPYSVDIQNLFFKGIGDRRLETPLAVLNFLSLSSIWFSLGIKDEKRSDWWSAEIGCYECGDCDNGEEHTNLLGFC